MELEGRSAVFAFRVGVYEGAHHTISEWSRLWPGLNDSILLETVSLRTMAWNGSEIGEWETSMAWSGSYSSIR
jgi:hypothetical protein